MKNKLKYSMSSATKTLILVAVLLFGTPSIQAQTFTTFAGNQSSGSSGDGGPATSAALAGPQGVCVDDSGNVYIADANNGRIRKVSISTGIINTIVTITPNYFTPGVTVDDSGNVYVSDYMTGKVFKVTPSGVVSTLATGLGQPRGLAVDALGNVYVANFAGDVKKITPAGVISIVIVGSWSGVRPQEVCVDIFGNVYVAEDDSPNQLGRIRKLTVSTGVISTIAGGGTNFSDGIPAVNSGLHGAKGVSVDASGSVYISNAGIVRKVDVSTGLINTIYYLPNGNCCPTDAYGICLSLSGDFYIADHNNQRILRVSCTGITTYQTVSDTNFSSILIDTDTLNVVQVDTIGNNVVTTTDSVFIATYVNTTAVVIDSMVFVTVGCTDVIDTTIYSDTTYISVTVMDTVTHESSDTTLINTTVANIGILANMKVYPNPFSDKINIDVGDETVDVVLTDALGRILMQTKCSGHVVVQPNVLSGVYFLRVTYNNKAPVMIKVIAE